MQTKLRSLLTIPVIAGAVFAGSSAVQAANIIPPTGGLGNDFLTGNGLINIKTLGSSAGFPAGRVDFNITEGTTTVFLGAGAFSEYTFGNPVTIPDTSLTPPNPFPLPPATYLPGVGLTKLGLPGTDPNPLFDLGGGNYFTAASVTGPIFIPFDEDNLALGTTAAYRSVGVFTSGLGPTYAGSILFTIPFDSLTPDQIRDLSLTPGGITRSFSYDATLITAVPEPSAVLGLVAVVGSSLLLRKRVKS